MKKTTKILLLTIIAIFVVTLTNSVQANYQIVYKSTVTDYSRTYGTAYINNIRNMEAKGQVMGLTETHNSSTLLSTSGSNYIDVHMEKNTEYGAMALLSASTKYGKQGSGTARYVGTGTTTGNVYGVYMNHISNNVEITAGTGTTGAYVYSTSINGKYVNKYTSASTRYNGDALLKWHNATNSNDVSNQRAIGRGYYGSSYAKSIFNFTVLTATSSSVAQYFARAVFVCGEGF